MDEAVGNVLGELRSAGLEENTLIFFFSDNGGPTMRGTTINASRNTRSAARSARHSKGAFASRASCQWKSKLSAGSVYEQPIIQLDVHATASPPPASESDAAWKLDGVNLLPYFAGQRNRHRRTTHSTGGSANRWPFAKAIGSSCATIPPPTTTRARPPRRRGSTTWLDIGEATDLAATEPDKLRALAATWQRWSDQMAKPLWGGPRP